VTVALFIVGVLISLGASLVLVGSLERLGARLRAPEAMLGLAVALAADSPEITTAVVALARRQQDIGVGVVLGSNIFNLAALLATRARQPAAAVCDDGPQAVLDEERLAATKVSLSPW
jgi:cation:H+ antiporter